MNYIEINNEFSRLKALPEIQCFDEILDFIEKLNSDSSIETMEYHYSLLKDKENIDLYYDIRAGFKKRGKRNINEVSAFLLEKLKTEKDAGLKADALQILGGLKVKEALPYAREFTQSDNQDFRYRGIIVTGWIGHESDIPLLTERLTNEPDIELRGYAATALRQIWFRLPDTKNEIVEILFKALHIEKEELVLQSIIIVLQDLLKKKFGLRENIEEAEITGDVFKAKDKALTLPEHQLSDGELDLANKNLGKPDPAGSLWKKSK